MFGTPGTQLMIKVMVFQILTWQGGGLVRFTSPFLGPGSTRNICSSGASAHVAVGIKAICRHIQQSLSGRQLFGFLGLPSQLPVASLDEVVKELDPLFSLCP